LSYSIIQRAYGIHDSDDFCYLTQIRTDDAGPVGAGDV